MSVNDDDIFLNSIPVYKNIDFAIYNNKITDEIHPEEHVNAIIIDPMVADYNLPTIGFYFSFYEFLHLISKTYIVYIINTI